MSLLLVIAQCTSASVGCTTGAVGTASEAAAGRVLQQQHQTRRGCSELLIAIINRVSFHFEVCWRKGGGGEGSRRGRTNPVSAASDGVPCVEGERGWLLDALHEQMLQPLIESPRVLRRAVARPAGCFGVIRGVFLRLLLHAVYGGLSSAAALQALARLLHVLRAHESCTTVILQVLAGLRGRTSHVLLQYCRC